MASNKGKYNMNKISGYQYNIIMDSYSDDDIDSKSVPYDIMNAYAGILSNLFEKYEVTIDKCDHFQVEFDEDEIDRYDFENRSFSHSILFHTDYKLDVDELSKFYKDVQVKLDSYRDIGEISTFLGDISFYDFI